MKKHGDKKVLQWIWTVSGKEKRNIVLLTLIQAFLGISSVIAAWFLRDVIDLASAQDTEAFRRKTLAYVSVILLQIICRSVKRYFDEYTRSGLENRFKERLFSTLLNRDFAKVSAVHSGEWLNRLTSDTVVAADGLTTILPDMIGMGLRLLGALGAILMIVPGLGYILLPGGLALLFVSWAFRKKSKKLHKLVQETDGKLRVFLSDRLTSILVVRSFARETQVIADAHQEMQKHQKVRMKRNQFSNLCNTGFSLIMNGVYVTAVIFCGRGILQGTMSFGSFTAILQLIGQVQSPFANITGYLPKFYTLLASAERLMEAESFPGISQEDLWKSDEVQKFYKNDFAFMGLKNAAFTYQPLGEEEQKTANPKVFSGVDLEIQKGDYAAFTGHSGCGKSTVLKLLMSLYHLDEGTCYLKTNDGREMILDERLIRLFAYVPQGNHLMSGTIREMVAFSDKEKMRDEALIRRSLEIACALEFVDALAEGIDTKLGERGLGLSEGQMQRIAIARAICSGNPILILDEATSALDDETEKRLLKNLKNMTDKTVLIVTHRAAVLDICNRHVVMSEQGIQNEENRYS